MTQLAGGDTVDDQSHKRGGDTQPDTQRMECSPFLFVPLVQHQKVEPASQAGDQRYQQYYNRSF
jgi:hypothetical protein